MNEQPPGSMRSISARCGLSALVILLVAGLGVPRASAQDAASNDSQSDVASETSSSEDARIRALTDSLLIHLGDETLRRVADAYEEIEAVRSQYRETWGDLEAADLPSDVEQEFLRTVVERVREQELEWQEYRDILTAVRNAPRLQRRFLPMIGQEVTVTAAKTSPMDLTAGRTNPSVHEIEAQELEAMPLVNPSDALLTLPGIERGLRVRGGGPGEVSLRVDGLSSFRGRGQAPFAGISLTQIEQIHVETGGFNAEHGNVRSGLIEVTTKGSDPAPDLVNVSREELRAIAGAYVRIQEIRREYGMVEGDLAHLDLAPETRREITSKMAVAIDRAGVEVDQYMRVIRASRTNSVLYARLQDHVADLR